MPFAAGAVAVRRGRREAEVERRDRDASTSEPSSRGRPTDRGAGRGDAEHEHGVALAVRAGRRAIQYPGHANAAGSAIGTRPRFRAASHWRQKTSGSTSGSGRSSTGDAERAREARGETRAPIRSSRQRSGAVAGPIHTPPSVYAPRPMATFTTRFLGCKVSFADEQAIRERLLADGHTEAARSGGRRRDQHLLRHERGRLEVAPGGRAGGAQPRARLRDGVRREPLERRVRRTAGQRRGRRAAQRGGRRGRRGRRRRDRLRPGRSPPRPRARLRQDPGRLLVLVRVLRDPARPRRHAQPLGGGGARARSGAASPRATGRSCSPASTSAASATATPG